MNKGQESDGKYHNLKEVIFIAIADCILFPEKKSYKSDHVVLDKETYEHNLKDFYFTFIELPKFKKDSIDQLNNMIEKWSFFFKHADETSEEDLQKLIGSDLVIQRAYDELNQFNWTEPELIAYEQEIKRMRDNVAALDYQIDKAKKEGLEKGREEGREEGRETEKIEIAKVMLSKNKPLEEIAEFTGLSLDEIAKLKKC